jgi:hypothetical protein
VLPQRCTIPAIAARHRDRATYARRVAHPGRPAGARARGTAPDAAAYGLALLTFQPEFAVHVH